MNTEQKVTLIILDGWGIGSEDPKINAVEAANAPFIKNLSKTYPHNTLITSGLDVGLPEGQMGNSEVGHLNIGAGRVVYQQLALINKAIKDHILDNHPELLKLFKYVKDHQKKLHLVGLVSKGGVHSSLEHVEALLKTCQMHGVEDVFIHAFTDGRDTDPKSGLAYLKELQECMDTTTGKFASVIGRYYAMDRDKRWERVKLAYDLLVHGKGRHIQDVLEAVQESYQAGITDEFIKPLVIVDDEGKPIANIENGDAVLFFNFRTDRGRELTITLTQQAFPELDMHPLDLYYVTMTQYDATYKNVKILFPEQDLRMTLGEVLENSNKSQLRIAETEKYPHVTFFFSGGREIPFNKEERIMVPSPKVATYDLQPEMSAPEVTNKIVDAITSEKFDFIALNFANPDMVGHTGVFSAVVKALEAVDTCAERVVNTCLAHGYKVIIIADHGNAEFEVNADGSPNTAHTTNPVPIYFVSHDADKYTVDAGRLADIAPSILSLMNIPQPAEMTGKILIHKKDE